MVVFLPSFWMLGSWFYLPCQIDRQRPGSCWLSYRNSKKDVCWIWSVWMLGYFVVRQAFLVELIVDGSSRWSLLSPLLFPVAISLKL